MNSIFPKIQQKSSAVDVQLPTAKALTVLLFICPTSATSIINTESTQTVFTRRTRKSTEMWVNWTAGNWSVLVPLLPQTVFCGNRKVGHFGESQAVYSLKALCWWRLEHVEVWHSKRETNITIKTSNQRNSWFSFPSKKEWQCQAELSIQIRQQGFKWFPHLGLRCVCVRPSPGCRSIS